MKQSLTNKMASQYVSHIGYLLAINIGKQEHAKIQGVVTYFVIIMASNN